MKWRRYIRSVQDNKVVVCDYVRKAVKRFTADERRKDIYFDERAAEAAITWIEQLVIGFETKEVKGMIVQTPVCLSLTDFQAFIVANIFGWKRKNGQRRFQYSYIEMAKGSGKTTLEAAIALLFLEISGKDGEVYSAATTRDQAKIAFRYAQSLARDSKHVRSKAMKLSIHIPENNSFFHPLSSDADSLEGKAPNFVIIDEFHAHQTDDVYNNLKSALVKKRGSHLSIITTAGFNRLSPCYRLRQTGIDILNGKISDDNTFVMIFTLDDGDDWEDESNWIKANPNLGVTFDIDVLRREYASIKTQGASQEVNFKTKNLNMWTDSSIVWITDRLWMKNAGAMSINELEGRDCYGGLDLASWIDLNAFVLLFPVDDKIALLPFFWIPESQQVNEKDKNDYRQWVRDGFILTTDGEVVNYNQVFNDIKEKVLKKYNLLSLSFDRKYANHGLVSMLINEGVVCNELPQLTSYLSPPTEEFERLVRNKEIIHFGNPVLRWMLSNVEIKRDTNNNIRVDKSMSKNKVDGISATINAVAEWMTFRNQEVGWGVTTISI